MTSLKILIVEDEIITAMDLRLILEKAGHTVTAIARTFEAAQKSVKANPPDLALIDIKLEESSTGNGIDTAKELVAYHPIPIIYLTANSEPATFEQAKATQPAAYLLKPFKASEILFNVELAYHDFQKKQLVQNGAATTDYLMLPVGKGLEKIDLDDVMYLEADGAYAKVVMVDKVVYTVSTHLGQLEPYFRGGYFCRLSRSHVVNLDFIRRLKDNEVLLTDNQTVLPIASTYRKDLLKRLTVVRTKPRSDNR
ncbi:response regulator [Spirosoma sp. BT702]|uniref:Response regulator n=1 Tax=Spirosoma profusum TaxID=2771354 RepID=A0A927AQJ5_9BACT|nr:response regulator [Spirosoma profusum]MBD2700648.1 response regulator [Spirosoma profusum]